MMHRHLVLAGGVLRSLAELVHHVRKSSASINSKTTCESTCEGELAWTKAARASVLSCVDKVGPSVQSPVGACVTGELVDLLTPVALHPVPAVIWEVPPMARAPCARVMNPRSAHPNVAGTVPTPVAADPCIARARHRWSRFDDRSGWSNLYVDVRRGCGRRDHRKSEGHGGCQQHVLDHVIILPRRHAAALLTRKLRPILERVISS